MSRYDNKKIGFTLLTIGFFLVVVFFFTTQHKISIDDKTGILVPLYKSPGQAWDDLIQEKNLHSSVPIVAIINPENGPGSWDQDYFYGIKKLQSADITVLGYVYTRYGARNSSEILAEIDSYRNLYGVNGIFFDEMSNTPGNEDYYRQLSEHAKSIGLDFTVGNVGNDTIPSYIGTVNNIIIYENSGLPPIDLLGGWHTKYQKSNFSFLSYNVSKLDEQYVRSASKQVGFLYITDSTFPNPWDSLTKYFDNLASIV